MNLPDDIAALLPVAEALESLGVPYYVGGSIASSIHGMSRATADVDLIADLQRRHVEPLVERVVATYYVSADAAVDAIRFRSSFNLIHFDTQFKVDIFIPKARAFDREGMSRRGPQQLRSDLERTVPVASPEDTVLAKLEWYRAGDEISDRQWRDLLYVLRMRRGEVDVKYLQRWAAELRVTDLLHRALAEAERLESGPGLALPE